MDDLLSKYLKSNQTIRKPKQPNLGEMNRDLKTSTSKIPAPITSVPTKSVYEPSTTIVRYSDVVSPLPTGDDIFRSGTPGSNPNPKDTRQTTYVNNNYAGDDYVD